ncbi:hypothetical protein QFC22_001396 [Naganishia vaughanmartiniae]|uniref:Uncharacterized protein n=1 Tax=Naganishia vaughanmartiniae TaxID=1424756 RepID=A0ACC2XGQ3_9TREE|nr:hypothetical protein QFC22_001396 [Naganishia vaughanmartiniae]
MATATTTYTQLAKTEQVSFTRPLSAAGPGFQRDRRRSAPGISASMGQTKVMDKRKNYYAVVVLGEEQYEGKIFESWSEAELEIKGHSKTTWKVFKTRLAAEAYVAKNVPAVLPSKEAMEAYDMQMDFEPTNSLGMPLHEHFSRNFRSSPPLSSSSLPLAPPRPHFARPSSRRCSNASSRLTSPLRQEVIEEETEIALEEAVIAPYAESPTVPEPLAANKLQRKSFLFAMKSVGRSASRLEKREKDQIISPPATPDSIARPTSSFKRHRSDNALPLASASGHDQGAPIDRPESPSAPVPSTWQKTPSIRSTTSRRSQTAPSAHHNQTAPPTTARSLWTDSVQVIDLTDRPATPPCSPGKVYEEYPELADPANNGSIPNTPKFSRSAMKKNGVTLPMPAPRSPSYVQANSPLGSPWQSPTGSRMTLGKSRSILSLDALSLLHERLADVGSPTSKTSPESDYFTALEQARGHQELPTHPSAYPPKLRSMVSSSSINSAISSYSFRGTPDYNIKASLDAIAVPDSPEGCHVLSPIPSNISTSDGTRTFSESGTSSSDSSHTRSTTSTGNSISDSRKQNQKTGGLKRFLKMFSMTRAGDMTSVA